ncbi:pitrilysin family protein [Thiomicrorhabdus sp.]|uniref:M16 family metallopeptidase n=1 Tax=Thiomicrorhabdus sp. TaxID=2039724 RepID=UPI0029C7E95C|nr:pitrilysin family protein [Thiomicrorhabdus sp.]
MQNGLQIVVKEDHRAPVVVHQIWYRVGSNYESNGITGISHMLEHMMFKGTRDVKPGEFSRKVARLGGEENAFTSNDYTAYYQVVGKQHLEEVMRLEADRMRNLQLDAGEFATERQVVTEEWRWRVQDRPDSKLYQAFKAMAFVNSPEHHPVIGWKQDIDAWTLEDLQNWYQKWYAPNNATLVVVGDVDPEEVFRLAERYYGKASAEKITALKPQVEQEQLGERRLKMKGATQLPSLLIGVHAPTLKSAQDETQREEVYALSLLNDLLDGDDSSILTRELVREQKAVVSAGSYYDPMERLTTLFTFEATPSSGLTAEEIEKRFWKLIEQLQKKPVSEVALQRVMAQTEASYVYQQDSLQGQAMLLGSLASVGLPFDTVDHWLERLKKVTPQQIQAVARKYFDQERATVAVLLPNGEKPNQARPVKLQAKGVH